MKIRLVVAGAALALASVALGAAPAQAGEGLGPSNCKYFPPGVLVSGFARAHLVSNEFNPGRAGSPFGVPVIPLFCNPHSTFQFPPSP